jgi:hopanoid-associated phosphorylase
VALIDFGYLVRDTSAFGDEYSMSGGIVAVTSLAMEARIAGGPGVSVICSQGERLAAALEAAVARGVCGIISFGVAGGLAPGLGVGDWIVATAVITGQRRFPTDQAWTRSLRERLPQAVHAETLGMDTPVADPERKQSLYSETGAVAVDMESHIAAAIAAAHRIPFAVTRVIIDPADRPLPPAALVGLRSDGTPDVAAVFRSVLQQPGQLPALVRTALDARTSGAALRRGRRMLGAGLGFPDFGEGHRVPAAKETSSPFPDFASGFAVESRRN